ncbi:MAG: DUF87 domain-containing protein, partial [Flavobacteriaceae bacterium]|nr:DUF87 domain-containing protein [Flavobacteriaceae bacterium]
YNHTYILGTTGEGKSSLLERMATYDANFGCAVIFIDPSGTSCRKVFHKVKDKSRVIYISIDNPAVINPISKNDYKIDVLIQEFIQILDVLITLTASNPESTVLMKMIIGYAMRSITKEEHKNVTYITKLLLNKETRKELVRELEIEKRIETDEYRFWKNFEDRDTWQTRESAQRVAARLSEISVGEMKQSLVGPNEIDIEDIIKNQKIVIVDTSRMNENSQIFLTNLLIYAVISYCQMSEAKYQKNPKPLMVYVDEVAIVASILFAKGLIGARKSGVGFTLAHQNFSLIADNILQAVISNAHTKIVMNCGQDEADLFSKTFNVAQQDLLNLPRYTAWIRIDRDNTLTRLYPPIMDDVPPLPDTIISPKPVEPKPTKPKFEYHFLSNEEDSWITF